MCRNKLPVGAGAPVPVPTGLQTPPGLLHVSCAGGPGQAALPCPDCARPGGEPPTEGAHTR